MSQSSIIRTRNRRPEDVDLAEGMINVRDYGAELIAELLAGTELLPAEALERARARAGNGSLAAALVDEGLASSEGVAQALARRHAMPFVDLEAITISPDAVRQIPVQVLERVVAVPYALEDGSLKVVIADPQNIHGVEQLRLATRVPLELGVASRDHILAEIRRLVRASDALAAQIGMENAIEFKAGEDSDLEEDDGFSDAPLVRLVNSIVFQAAEDNASDVHFEPRENALVVRFRIDGVLQEMQRIPRQMAAGVTTRLKVLAKLDIAERRKPQDGRISLTATAAGRLLDIRVATLPIVEGETVVLRLLDKSKEPPTLEELGLSSEIQQELRQLIRRPTGALLVTGPTGSGKSTTLYASLAEINRPEVNIITVEDPVEYRLAGVNQIQINPRAGLTFATALRSILRSDPDVIMVGEIRDSETAKISIESALTGHLVLSTMHTNDAPGALTRLNEMGVEPFLTGSAVSAVLAQRLARVLCRQCREAYTPSDQELRQARVTPELLADQDEVVFYRKGGCPRCSGTGYRGRVGIFQFLKMSETIESLAVSRAPRDEIEKAARSEGMRALWEDGLAKVVGGLTSVEELARAVSA